MRSEIVKVDSVNGLDVIFQHALDEPIKNWKRNLIFVNYSSNEKLADSISDRYDLPLLNPVDTIDSKSLDLICEDIHVDFRIIGSKQPESLRNVASPLLVVWDDRSGRHTLRLFWLHLSSSGVLAVELVQLG